MSIRNRPILRSKLHPPSVTQNLVSRPRLLARLDLGLSRPLTLVSAAAGFGKSTLVSQWFATLADGRGSSTRIPASWLALDESDSDLSEFLRYWIAALRTIFVDACAATEELLQARRLPPFALVAATLCNDMERLSEEFVLVLEDYHQVRGTAVHDLLNELTRHWPLPMHLVLVSRRDPPLPLARLRANGMVEEIRNRDLRFASEETRSYLSRTLPVLPNEATIAALEQRTEGWIAGLQLARLTLVGLDDADGAVAALSASDFNLADYLANEVLSRQPAAIQDFLLQTSVLDRYCSSLCIAVFEGSDPEWTVRSCMDWLERGDLFVYALDDERIWYRYHHLFRDMLQAKARSALGVERWNELHRRAARWYAAQEMVNEGIHYALECEDMELASHLIEDGLCDALNREDRPTLEQWLHLIPEESFQGRPGLLLFKAWVLVLNWQREAGSRLLQQVEALLDGETLASAPAEQRSLWRGQVLAIRCQDAYFDNQHALAVALSREALELLPSSWTFARGAATMYNGFAMQAMGQGPAAERTLLDAYELAENKANSYAQRMLMALSMNYAMAGNLEQVAQVARVMLQQTTASRLGLLEGWAHYFLGYVAYQANDLDGASLHFAAILERRHTVHVAVVREAASLLALIHQARGAVAEADRVVEQLERADVELTGREDLSTAAVKAELMLRRGDVEGASRWADSIMEGPPNRPLVWLMQPHLTKARVLLARNLDTDAQDALQILDYLHDIAERSLNTRARIEILTLRALAMDALGNGGAAERDLQLAVELARPGGFVRVFVDGGARLEMLLGRLSKRGIAPATVRRIMAAFPDRKRGNGASAAIAIHGQNHSHFDTPLAEPLTEREMDILVQLCEPMSAKEIARALNVSPLTVKRHAANIYAKLGVNSRWDAVARARTLGILAPH